MADNKRIPLNGIEIEIQLKSEEPLRLTEDIGVTSKSEFGETIEIVRLLANPFVFLLRGEKITGKIDLRPIIKEGLLHVTKENA